MQLLAVDEGELCALSPNQSLYAIVKKGLTVLFMDYIRRTTELMNCVPPDREGGGGGGSYSGGAAAVCCRRRRVDAVIFKHTALDEIHELQWSPDSTLVSLLLGRRRIVEIVSVYGKCCVARIDAGVAGLRAVLWHPSSRVVYWVSLLQAHVLSLVDSQVMRLAGNVKYSAQLAARCSMSRSSIHGNPSCSSLSSSSSANTTSKKNSAAAAAADGMSKVEYPVSEAALLRFSRCRRFLLYVTPRLLYSPLSASVGEAKSSTHVSDAVMDAAPAAPTTLPSPAVDCEESEGVHPRRSEWLVVASSTTHEELHAFPTRHLVPSVSDIITLQGGIALVDYISGSLVLTTYNGAHVLHREPSGVQNTVASKSGDVLFIVLAGTCRAVLVNAKRVLALRCISFEADVVLPLQLRAISVLEEPPSAERSSTAFSCPGEPYRRDADAIARLFMSADRIGWRKPVKTSSIGQAAISASGKLAAVTLGLWPSTVLVVDIPRQVVMAVLCHREAVTGLFWSSSPRSEYWRFQQRHYMRQQGEVCGSRTGGDARTGGSCGVEEPLLVTTDNHEAKVFLWLPEHAVCFAASRLGDDNAATSNEPRERRRCMCSHDGSPPTLRVGRGMFGNAAADAVLVDDMRGIALTVAFRNVWPMQQKAV